MVYTAEHFSIRFLSLAALIAGVVGMMVCAFYILVAPITEAIAAGLPFVAGAILFSIGLACLTYVNHTTTARVR